MLAWFHLCIVVDLETRLLIFRLNDQSQKGLIKNVNGANLQTLSGGILVLGQEQNFLRGDYSSSQGFQGYIADYRLFNKTLSYEALDTFITCSSKETLAPLNDTVVSFNNLATHWYTSGSTEKVFVTNVCEEPSPVYILFPERRDYMSSFRLCKMLKGEIVAPRNENENKMLVDILTSNATEDSNLIQTCSSEYGTFMWLGIKTKDLGNEWTFLYDPGDTPLNYSKFRHGYSYADSTFRCILFDIYNLGFWSIYPCNLKVCVTCKFSLVTQLRLRGLCKDSLIDNKYLLSGYFNAKPKLEGIKYSRIVWQNNTWVIWDSLKEKVVAYMWNADLNQYPFGLHKWHINEDICPEKEPQLLLTPCQPHQYTCNDGTCIPKMQRCDLQLQCPDQSDESFCTTIVIPKFYIKEVRLIYYAFTIRAII